MAESVEKQPEGAILISPAQCRAARAWLGWKQSELAQRSGVGLSALKDFEADNRRTLSSIRAQLQRTFEDAGVSFPTPHSMDVETSDG